MPFFQLSSTPTKVLLPGFEGKIIHTDNQTIAFWEIKAGSALPAHQHIHEQITTVVSGQLSLTLGAETQLMEAGSVATIAPNIIHSGKAITDCTVIDVFTPVREDYKIL
jgi:quercetin dioxygenase-like cupin family protein